MEAAAASPTHTPNPPSRRGDLGRMALLYDALALAYSGGAISASRRWALQQVPRAGRVLFAGCGGAGDAIAAAGSGASVTAVDRDPGMISGARRRSRRAGPAARLEILHGDVFELDRLASYDAVVASCFLNVFDERRLPWVVSRLVRFLRVGGQLIVVDFAGPVPGSIARRIQRLYHDLPMRIFARLGANEAHPLHDIAGGLVAMGLQIQTRRRFRLCGVGPAWWEGLVAARNRDR